MKAKTFLPKWPHADLKVVQPLELFLVQVMHVCNFDKTSDRLKVCMQHIVSQFLVK